MNLSYIDELTVVHVLYGSPVVRRAATRLGAVRGTPASHGLIRRASAPDGLIGGAASAAPWRRRAIAVAAAASPVARRAAVQHIMRYVRECSTQYAPNGRWTYVSEIHLRTVYFCGISFSPEV